MSNDHSVNAVVELSHRLDQDGIPHVSWKNNHELGQALSGARDIDLFVPLRYRSAFMRIVGANNWLRVENPVARFPFVTHLYKTSDAARVYHLHVYFKVVTGESWLKEYILPLDEFLIENRVRGAESMWVLDSRAQAYLFVIRHLLKGGSLASRKLYRRDLESYRLEWLACSRSVTDLAGCGPIDVVSHLRSSGVTVQSLSMPPWRAALRFRVSLAPLLRVPMWSLPWKRLESFLSRAANRVLLRRRKLLVDGGIVIAVSGVDGAGKSTLLRESTEFFQQFLTVERLSLGRPQGRVLESVRRAFGSSSRTVASASDVTMSTSEVTSVRRSISAMVLALLRLATARRAARRARSGALVLADRWPTGELDRMDGPRLRAGSAVGGVLQRACAKIEHWAYARIPPADVCFFLTIPLAVALERNRARTKKDKESDDEIIARYNQNQRFSPLALKVIAFENAGDLEEMRRALILQIWKELVAQ